MNDLNFRHRYIPSSPLQTSLTYKHNKDELRKIKDHKLGSVTLLLLHGTGGNEDDLIPLGQKISPSASLLSPRGKVLENGMPRFFKRLSEGVFDFEDLKYRTRELSDFVKKASNAYGFDLARTIAVGFSNGANMAASLLFSYPEVLSGAILYRAMVPFVPNNSIDLSGKKVFISAGRIDPIVPESHTEHLFEILRKNNADVFLKWQQAGHNLIETDLIDSRYWISEKFY